MNRFICFIHIPKTAGTTFHNILHDNNPMYLTLERNARFQNEFDGHDLRSLRRYLPVQGIGGHDLRPYLNYEEVSTVPVYYITYLRDPVHRYVSFVNHVVFRGWKNSLEDVLRDRRYDNQQTRQLAGSADADAALRQLERISLTGITEKFDESLLLLKADFPAWNIAYQPDNLAKDRKDNRNQYRVNELSPDTICAIEDANALDIRVYEVGKELLAKRICEYPGDFEADLRDLQKSRETYRRSKLRTVAQKARNLIAKLAVRSVARGHTRRHNRMHG